MTAIQQALDALLDQRARIDVAIAALKALQPPAPTPAKRKA